MTLRETPQREESKVWRGLTAFKMVPLISPSLPFSLLSLSHRDFGGVHKLLGLGQVRHPGVEYLAKASKCHYHWLKCVFNELHQLLVNTAELCVYDRAVSMILWARATELTLPIHFVCSPQQFKRQNIL